VPAASEAGRERSAVGVQAGGRPRPRPENLWLNLLFNAVLPGFLLSWASSPTRLGPVGGMFLALAFPVVYGAWDLWTRKTWNVIAVLGFVSTLLTGLFGLVQLGGFWFAVKEAALPLVIAAAIPWSLRTRQPLVRVLLYNDQVLDTGRIQAALEARGTVAEFDRLLRWASWMLAGSMLVSAVTNFLLAWWLLPAVSGNEVFNRQLGKLQFWSWPGTMLPTGAMVMYALFRLLRGVETMTGLRGDALFHPKR